MIWTFLPIWGARPDESYHLQKKRWLLVRSIRPVCNILSHTDNSYHLQKKTSDPTELFAAFCPIRINLIICKKDGQRQTQPCYAGPFRWCVLFENYFWIGPCVKFPRGFKVFLTQGQYRNSISQNTIVQEVHQGGKDVGRFILSILNQIFGIGCGIKCVWVMERWDNKSRWA